MSSVFSFACQPIGKPRILMAPFVGATTQAGTAKRVFLIPLWVPSNCQIDEIICYCITASAGKNFRLGLYQKTLDPSSNSPDGAALLTESGNLAAAVGPLQWVPGSPVTVKAGLVWIALATEDAIMAFYRSSQPAAMRFLTNYEVDGCYYTLGAWGALTSPCPAVTISTTARLTCFAHVY